MRKSVVMVVGVFLVSGCATKPLSEQVFRQKFPAAVAAAGENSALIKFSADSKYESARGVPLAGDPLLCGPDGMFRVNTEDTIATPSAQTVVKAGKEIAVTSVIRWVNGSWKKTCWPFVAFTPEAGSTYVVVNERIGGKGWSALWTGVKFQTCQVSVFKETATGIESIETRQPSSGRCRQSPN